jgi:hypothetical protein
MPGVFISYRRSHNPDATGRVDDRLVAEFGRAQVGERAAEAPFGPPLPPDLRSARERAPVDLTGQWVAVITEDWRWRMLTPRLATPRAFR